MYKITGEIISIKIQSHPEANLVQTSREIRNDFNYFFWFEVYLAKLGKTW